MALSVTSNFSINAGYASNNMRNSQTLMGKSINRISSGLKAFRPSDDLVSFVGGTKLKSDSLGYNMLSTSVQDTAAKLNMADGVLSELGNGLLELKAQAIAYKSLSDKGGDEASALKNNFVNTRDMLKQLVPNAKYKNEALFGTSTSINVYFGFDTAVAFNAANSAILLAKTWNSASGIFKNMADISKYSVITAAISTLTQKRSQLGGNISALETISNYLSNVATSADAAYTAVTEVDMAREMTAYVKNNIQSQAAQAMVAQANQGLAQVLNLLQV